MDSIEQKLGAILNDPNTMQQIMAMAQALGQIQNEQPPSPASPSNEGGLDLGMLQKLTGMMQGISGTKEEAALLNALCPYLCAEKVHKLEKAMRAAKMARLASSFLNSGGLQLLTGR